MTRLYRYILTNWRRILGGAFWFIVFIAALTVDAWSEGLPMAVAVLLFIAVMTYIAAAFSGDVG